MHLTGLIARMVEKEGAKATYRQRITQFTEELDFLSEADKDWVMGRALLARLGWT